jgi:hypothetical protein
MFRELELPFLFVFGKYPRSERGKKAQEAKLILSDANCGQGRGRTRADEWRKANGIWVSLFPSLARSLTHFFLYLILFCISIQDYLLSQKKSQQNIFHAPVK